MEACTPTCEAGGRPRAAHVNMFTHTHTYTHMNMNMFAHYGDGQWNTAPHVCVHCRFANCAVGGKPSTFSGFEVDLVRYVFTLGNWTEVRTWLGFYFIVVLFYCYRYYFLILLLFLL